MKHPLLESIWDTYKDVCRPWYPKHIVCPPDYYDPMYYALIAVTQERVPHTLVPREEVAVAKALRLLEMPTYFIDGEFLQSVLRTDLKHYPKFSEIHFPLEAMLLVLPQSVSRQHFFGFDVPFIGFGTGQGYKDSQPTGMVFVFHSILLPSDGRPLGYYGRIPFNDEISQESICKYEYKDETGKVDEYIKWRWNIKDGKDPSKHSSDVLLPTVEQDRQIIDRVFMLTYKLLLVLNATREENAKNGDHKYISKSECVRKAHLKHGKDELWSACMIGKSYEVPRGVYETTGTHASPRLHWRRGHIRQQPWGKGRLLSKPLWIEPMLVGS